LGLCDAVIGKYYQRTGKIFPASLYNITECNYDFDVKTDNVESQLKVI